LPAVLVAGLPLSHKIGLGLVALAFITFALVSSFVLPRYRKDFPGESGLGGFIALSVVFFCAMIAAVWFFGKEPKEAEAHAQTSTATAPATTSAATTAPATSAAASTAAGPTTTAAPPAAKGDAAAGKALFAANGCSSCHTFTPAGATGKVGPDLDHLAADAQKANRGSLDQYTTESIKDPGAYVVPGFPNGVMPPFAGLGDQKIADLVAFLTQGS
jgi:mono/diheme cytochrome c family protein